MPSVDVAPNFEDVKLLPFIYWVLHRREFLHARIDFNPVIAANVKTEQFSGLFNSSPGTFGCSGECHSVCCRQGKIQKCVQCLSHAMLSSKGGVQRLARDAQRRVNRATTGGRLAREVQHRQRAPRGQGGQPLALRLNDQLGVAIGDPVRPRWTKHESPCSLCRRTVVDRRKRSDPAGVL